jgi:hypothetical protein
MPSQWMSVFQAVLNRFRNRPSAIAAAAGGIGLVCGALAMAMTAQPTPPPTERHQAAVQVPSQGPVAARPLAETTGTAPRAVRPDTPTAETAATPTSDCDAQAWPYITRECLAKRHAERSRVRIITTDRITPPAPVVGEPNRTAVASPASMHETKPQARAAVIAAAETPAETIAVESVPLPLPRPDVASAKLANENVAGGIAEMPAPAPSKRARNARLQQREQGSLRRAAQSVRGEDRVTEMDRPRGRVVERWTEREFDVPSERGMQRRRVIVRSGGGYPPGPFGAMFGTVFR